MRLLLIISIGFLLLQNCKKDEDYPSILGEWLVVDVGEMSSYQQYNVSIQRVPSDTSLYKIINFYKTGNNQELIVEIEGFELIINGQGIGNYYFEGGGVIQSDFKRITLEYQVLGGSVNEAVESEFTRK